MIEPMYTVEPLTRRERDILACLEKGFTNREIAQALVLSDNSVKGYTRQIYSKLGVHGRREAVRLAQQLGLLASSTASDLPGSQVVVGFNLQKGTALPALTPLPTGTVTFLFTDIEGSTPLWERQPEKMAEALQIHNAALCRAIEAHAGVVFKFVGDAFQAAFDTALQALRAAISGQQALQTAVWNELGPLKVRMGLHTGEAQLDPNGDEYAVSHTMNRIGRIHSLAYGGQILLSQETADLVVRQLPESAWLKDLGEHHLKGMALPEHLFQVCAPGLAEVFPPLPTAIIRPNNLPVQLTSFIGRRREIAQVKELLRQHRLVTITGVGGTGKTRLSLCLGQELLEAFPQGVFFVNLAPVREPSLVISAIAQVFSLHEIPARSLKDVLKEHLASKHLLLILDNFEQVLEAGPDLLGLLEVAPQIKMLVTSRALLRISGEVNYPLKPLDLLPEPRPPVPPPPEKLVENEAMQLFVERARAVCPDFQLTPENAVSVAEICCRLDGLPLAIELAAPRLRLLSPQQMLQQLGHRLDLLVGAARDAPARHQTMRAAIEWSVSMLTEQEKTLFRRLGVFAGGCTLEAATMVCGEVESDSSNGKIDVLSGIGYLLDHNLLWRSEAKGDARFWMFETIREYALEELERSGESDAAHRKFARYFTRQELYQDFNQKELEIDNLRGVFRWSIDSGDVAPGLILGADFRFWGTHITEARQWLKELLATPAAQTAPERLWCVYGAGGLASYSGNLTESVILCKEFEDLFLKSPEQQGEDGFLHILYGFYAAMEGNYEQACLENKAYIRWAEMKGDHFHTQVGLSFWAGCELVLGHIARARELFLAALQIVVEDVTLGRNEFYECQRRLGYCELEENKPVEAEQRFIECIHWVIETGYRLLLVSSMRGLSAAVMKKEQFERSARLYGATEQISILQGGSYMEPWDEVLHQRYFASLREQMDPQLFECAFQEGRSMSLEEALNYALET